METLTIKSKYANSEEKVLEGNTFDYKIDISSNIETSVRIFNHSALERWLFHSGIFQQESNDNFEYLKVFVGDNADPIIYLTTEDVERINYRLELGTANDDSCREYIEYITTTLV